MNDQERDDLIERVANALDVPEPSPLFWEHFPQRVRTAVTATPVDARAWWRRRPAMLAAALAVAAVAAGSMFLARQPATPDAPLQAVAVQADEDGLMGEDPDWAVMSSLAVSAGVEMMREAGFGVAPGGAEAAIEDLSDAERAELVAMLRAEMKGDDAGGS